MPFKDKNYWKEYGKKRKKQIHSFERQFFAHKYNALKNRNKKRHPEKLFNITVEYIIEIFPKNKKCPVLGTEFEVGYKHASSSSPSLDRIDNNKGYEIGNVIWVSHKVNNIKSSATPDEIIKVGEFYKKLLEERSLE